MNLHPIELYNGLTNKEFNDALLEDEDRSIIYVCTCTMMECDCIYMKIEQTTEHVVWRGFSFGSQGDSEHTLSFKFTRTNYDECLKSLVEFNAKN